MKNLAAAPEHKHRRAALEARLMTKLKGQQDPRIAGQGDVFDNYPYAGAERGLYERRQNGEDVTTGWVNRSDYEPAPLNDHGAAK